MNQGFKRYSMGWLPDLPSHRDFHRSEDSVSLKLKGLGQKDSIKAMLKKIGVARQTAKFPAQVDLRPWCSPIENQESLGSCTAHAAAGLVEFFERFAFGKHTDISRLFLYKVTRNLLHMTGDTGAFLRSTMGALVLFGVPPEEFYPYQIANFEKEPSAFCYSFAQNFQAITYYRLDPNGIDPSDLLQQIKSHLSASLPSIFGFTCFDSLEYADSQGGIAFPSQSESVIGGHAVMAVGYDDSVKIVNPLNEKIETTGAILIRNSWGADWGDSGYGWLPYEYVLKGLAQDWWSLLKNEWVDTDNFKA
jgi:C1A family cysteine protease